MFDPKMVEAVARALLDRMPFHSPWEEQYPGVQRRFREDATAAIKALCAHLRLPPEALNALAAGEAVVVPREGSAEINRLIHGAIALHLDPWEYALAASPYALPKKGGGDE